MALIEEVFPGRVMAFTPASSAADGDAADPAAVDAADPDSFTAEPEEIDD